MRTILGMVLAAALAAGAAGCGGGDDGAEGRYEVVAAFYPLAEAARQVGGTVIEVTDLTPSGSEPHDLEPTTSVIDRIESADLVLVMGRHFQPSIESATNRKDDGLVITMLDALRIPKGDDDPHVWLDPVQMMHIVRTIREALQIQDSENEARFLEGEREYLGQLEALDAEFRDGLANCRSRIIVTSHDAFGWLAKRYGLEQHSIAGLSPDQEPDPRRLSQLADLVRDEKVSTIFTEALVSPKVAETLAREAEVTTEVLSPIEALTKRERDAGDDYLSLMRANLRKLRAALACT
jgi:zinc transport system substrate-binding protein